MRDTSKVSMQSAPADAGLDTWGLRVEFFRTLRMDQIVQRADSYKFFVMSKNETQPRDVLMLPEAYTVSHSCSRGARA